VLACWRAEFAAHTAHGKQLQALRDPPRPPPLLSCSGYLYSASRMYLPRFCDQPLMPVSSERMSR
jgi:hypothetical protein